MTSVALRRAHNPLAAIAAALVLLTASSASSAAERDARAADDQYLQRVQEILGRDGPYSLALLEPLQSLGELYRSEDDLVLALATLERALQIVRINNGLHTLDQVPLALELIRIEEARGNEAGVWEREKKLLVLLRRHPDDVRTVPALREIADKQMAVLSAVMAGEQPPQILLGCFYKQWPGSDDGSCNAGSRRTVVQGMLAEAQRTYADAIGVLLRNGLYESAELRDLELAVLRGVDLLRSLNRESPSAAMPMVPAQIFATTMEPWRSRVASVAALADWDLPYASEAPLASERVSNFVRRHVEMMDPYERGRQSLLRLYAYSAASSSSPLEQADAAVQLADWDLLHSHNSQAIDSYSAAYAMLADAGADEASVAQLFMPATPVVLPAFQPNPLVRDGASATGYIDVAFEITQYGRGRAIEIRGSANASKDDQERLVNLLRSSRFRPRMANGQIAAATPVAFRYFVGGSDPGAAAARLSKGAP